MPTSFLSLDIETSGLDPATCDVLSLALVAHADWLAPVDDLPCLHLLVGRDVIRGAPAALAMNAGLIAQYALRPEQRSLETVELDEVGDTVLKFVRHFLPGGRVTLAGKNAAGFDLPFLRRLPRWPDDLFRHRVIDAGNLWWEPATDDRLPDTAECLRRAGLSNEKPHDALGDARAVVNLVRKAYAMGRLGATKGVAA